MDNGRTIKVKDLVYMLRKQRKVILLLVVLATVLGIGLTALSYYLSGTETINKITASFAVVAENGRGNYSSNNTTPQSQDIYLAENMVESVMYVCTSDTVLDQVVSNLGLFGVTADSIRNALTITQYKTTQIIELTFYWQYPNEGVNILTEITNVAPDILVKTLGLGSVTVVNQAKVAMVEQRPNIRYLTGAIVIAIAVGLIYSFSSLYIHPTLVDTKEVHRLFELDELTELPHDALISHSSGRLSALDAKASSNLYRDSIDRAIHILNYTLQGQEGCQCLFVTSSMAGEGKTGIVAYLGIGFARMGKRVLLIDLDVQNPSLSGVFLHKPQYEHSLNAAVNDDIPAMDAIVPLEHNLDLVPTRLEKKRIMIDRRLGDIINLFKENYDLILIDTAPVGQVADTMQTSQITDKALYIIRYDTVWIDVIQDNIERLQKTGAHILGCIINDVDKAGNTTYYYQTYGYGYHGSRATKPPKNIPAVIPAVNEKTEANEEGQEHPPVLPKERKPKEKKEKKRKPAFSFLKKQPPSKH